MRMHFHIRSLPLIAVAFSGAAFAQDSPLTIGSAASYKNVVAPAAFASIFGNNLSAVTLQGQLDDSGQYPTQIGGTTVEFNGKQATLAYVSPGQINCVVPADVDLGTVTVVVHSSAAGTPFQGSVQVQLATPGVFSLDGTGTGDGAILNGVTYAGEPFLVNTPELPGDDQRTRLAVFGTGFRYAGNLSRDPSVVNVATNVQASARSASGRTFTLAVEYAGAASVYPGLDQINVVLPPEADGAGVLTLSIAIGGDTSNPVTFAVSKLSPNAIDVAGLTLSQSFVRAGNGLTGTVSLTAPAPSPAGRNVTLRSSSSLVQVAGSVTVPAGAVSADFPITTSSIPAGALNVSITASTANATRTATLRLDPANAPRLTSIGVTPASLKGGGIATGTVTLSTTAPTAGTTVGLSSDNSAAQVPASVDVSSRQSSATFQIPTSVVASAQKANITATFGSDSQTASLNVNPAIALALAPNPVAAGTAVTGTVTLGNPAPLAGATVNLRSSSLAVTLPAFLTIAAGQTTASFTITTTSIASGQSSVTITASYAGDSQTATLTVNAGSVVLSSLAIAPTTIQGGGVAAGTVTLTGPAPATGLTVNLRTSNFGAAQVPAFVTVPSGQSTAQFNIQTSTVFSSTTVTITATAAGVSQTATLTVN